MRTPICLFVLLLALALASGLAGSQSSTMTSQERQEILNYKLTLPVANHLIAALEAMTKYVLSLPDWQSRLEKSMKMSRAETIAQMEKDPKVMEILKQNGLTAKEYVVGVPALRMAIWAAQGSTAPEVVASPASIAFAKANLAQLKPKLDAADQRGARR